MSVAFPAETYLLVYDHERGPFIEQAQIEPRDVADLAHEIAHYGEDENLLGAVVLYNDGTWEWREHVPCRERLDRSPIPKAEPPRKTEPPREAGHLHPVFADIFKMLGPK